MATLLSSLGIGFLVTFVLFLAYSYLQDKRRNPAGLPYPPGPKGYPIIGNLFDIPNAFIYKRFREMSRELSERPLHRELSPSMLTNLRMQILTSSIYKYSGSISLYATAKESQTTFLINGHPFIQIGKTAPIQLLMKTMPLITFTQAASSDDG